MEPTFRQFHIHIQFVPFLQVGKLGTWIPCSQIVTVGESQPHIFICSFYVFFEL
jgi:hypothetical protein